MKKLLVTLAALAVFGVHAEAEVKRVCRDVEVKGKTVEQCKNVKVHQKFEGTKVPEKAPEQPKNKK